MPATPARLRPGILLLLALLTARAAAQEPAADTLFTGPVPRLQVEISEEGMAVLRQYRQVWRQTRPDRVDVRATVREGTRVWTNVAVHLKGSWTFQPIDERPSLTLNFGKFAKGQRFHGLGKIHLNNSIQDPAALHEPLARELFLDLGVPTPRATPAVVRLNDRDLGWYLLVEGANRQFVQRHFRDASGNLYDGGAGGDVTRALEVDSGDHPEDRSDLTNLVAAAREADPARRLARLEQVLDVERFVTFAAVEAYLVHWDGYAIGCNNYRVVQDAARGRLVFVPHGLDQILGVSASIGLSLTPVFKGMVAKSLFAVPEARQRYLRRIESLSTNELRPEALHARVERLAARYRPALPVELAGPFQAAVAGLKTRITQRAASVAEQLRSQPRPIAFPADGVWRPDGWTFRPGPGRTAQGGRVMEPGGPLLRVTAQGAAASGSWRTTLFLDEGHYEFSGRARTRRVTAVAGATNGVLLRISGERAAPGIVVSEDWKSLTYVFDVRGWEDVELVCEFRAAEGEGEGEFDSGSLRLTRRGPPRPLAPPPAQSTTRPSPN